MEQQTPYRSKLKKANPSPCPHGEPKTCKRRESCMYHYYQPCPYLHREPVPA